MGEYDYSTIEKKWQDYWQRNETFKVGAPGPKKLYALDMFPYPSGSGLHLGHPVGYTATDIYSRFKRMCGYSVLHPMGWDAFGLPAEQHAMSTGEHPSLITEKNCARFRTQMNAIGLSYDWSREIFTCRPDYYKWTQWIFLKIYNSWFDPAQQKARPISELPVPTSIAEAGDKAVEEYRAQHRLAYYADATVNWCPALGTVLANEEVIDGKSERGGHDVVRRPMKQWMLRITVYTERLLSELEGIDWPESIKEQQRNWIGKKHGAEIRFKVQGSTKECAVAFTTRPDTLFGVTFFVLSPEHPLVDVVTAPECREKVQKYKDEATKLSDFLRTIQNRKKTGVFTGGFVLNPITGDPVPVYVGDYVLMTVGTGAVMGVPAHDERDFEFARTFNIDIKPVVIPVGKDPELIRAVSEGEVPWVEEGVMLPSDAKVARELQLEGKKNKEAHELICRWLEKHHAGRSVINYKLRDWLFSRQRYWGEPIPIIHWEDGKVTAIDESELPLLLPEVVEYKPSESGESPLARATDWLHVVDPKTGKKGRRETNTMPQWAGSCWYYLRFIDPHNEKKGWDPSLEKGWQPVDMYVGGAEHAVLHLLYSRFWHKVLFDLGYVSTREPFQKLVNQGMLLAHAYQDKRGALVPVDEVIEGDDGIPRHQKTGEVLEQIVAKMSKSLRNVVTPDEIIQKYGADTLRLYLMFMGPIDCSRTYDAKAILGIHRFLRRTWTFVTENRDEGMRAVVGDAEESRDSLRAINLAVKRVAEDYESLRFNTALSSLMEYLNKATDLKVSKSTLEKFVLLLAPSAPHLAEELWTRLGHAETLSYETFPTYEEALLVVDTTNVVIQVNGKKRGLIEVSPSIDEKALHSAVIQKMATTEYKVTEGDRFITVTHPETKVPKLVNVISKSVS